MFSLVSKIFFKALAKLKGKLEFVIEWFDSDLGLHEEELEELELGSSCNNLGDVAHGNWIWFRIELESFSKRCNEDPQLPKFLELETEIAWNLTGFCGAIAIEFGFELKM